MILFLVPAGLLAAAGILVPILLHLWRRPARTVRLGSLRFLEKLPGRRLRDLRWRDRLLLLVRCALLLVLASLLAEPQWIRHRDGPQRWALLAPETVLDGSAESEWRTLVADGYAPRLLAPGFPSIDFTKTQAMSGSIDAWSLLREAAARVPTGSKLVLFAPLRMSSLRGKRPMLPGVDVRWVAARGRGDSESTQWIDPASVTALGNGLRATIGTTDANATHFSTIRVDDAAHAGTITDRVSGAKFSVRNSAGQFSIRLVGEEPGEWLPAIAHRPLRVAIVHGPKRAEDARYVAAAARAVGENTDRPVSIEIREESASAVVPESDWLFRLGAAPLTASQSSILAEDRVSLVLDAPRDAKEMARQSWFVSPDDLIDINGTRLWRRAESASDAELAIWSDGFGDPLLTFAREGRAQRWRFLSRFHPEATDWVERDAFPAWMQVLLLGHVENAGLSTSDRRLADLQQVQPGSAIRQGEESMLPPAAGSGRDLSAWCWMLAALLLVIERTLSLRKLGPITPTPATSPKRASPELEAVQ